MWKVTHIDAEGRLRRLRVAAANGRLAEAWALQLWGDARRLSVICLGRGA